MREKVKLTANILFSGIGCQERGFQDSGLFDIEVLNTSDINKESVLSYAAIHCGMTNEMVETYKDYPSREKMAQYLTDINLGYEPEKNKYFDWFKLVKKKNKDLEKYWLACKLTHNLGDISRIKELPYADFWTCSFPCTDISVAGKMKGLDPDSGTRSSLLWKNIKLLKKAKENNTLPKYIMVENVKNLVSKKFIGHFNNLISVFDNLGFNTYWSVINGKDCDVPQNRERVFVIAIRKDIDTQKYIFPQSFDTGIRLKDILQEVVDEKYYLSLKLQKKITDVFDFNLEGDIAAIDKSVNQTSKIEFANCITAREDRGISNRKSEGTAVVQLSHGFNKGGKFSDCPSITSHSWEQNNFIVAGQFQPKDRDHNSKGKKREEQFEIRKDGLSNAVLTGSKKNCIQENCRIRKLTPRECYRLMGLTFEDCDKAAELGVADTHLYKQAGNGIITNCCALLAEHLYKAQYDNTYICTDERHQENFTNPQVE